MAIGEIVLGSFFQVLFDKLSSLALDYVQQRGNSTTILDEWKRMLVTINAVLDDAEEKRLSGYHLVKLWVDDVRDLAFDIEDLLDEFEIKATQAKLEAESRKRKFFSFRQPCLLVSDTKVQEINGRLEAIVNRKACLCLRENVVDRSNYIHKRDPTSSLPEPQFIGREKEEMEMLELLIHEVKNSHTTLSIVPIVGMGGVGKTALAQQLYNDAKVNSYFKKKAWVCVSDVFDVLDITKTILRSITGLSNEDDIWNEKYEKWTVLLKPFEAGAKGSKIIITTRNLTVASITKALPYRLRELSFDNCTSLLAFHALGATNFESHPTFEIIGKKIAKRCKGLPLAAKMLGGLLRTKSNPDEWEDTLNNKIWDLLMAENDEVLSILKLSYIHLPSYLKRCFAYCAVFPKDYEIVRDELVLLWIAEGFLDGQKANKNILKLGRKHFDELVSRSFLQQSSINESKFLMHDLLNDLAKSIAGETCFSSGGSQEAGNEHDVSSLEKTRYASFISSRYVTSKCLRPYHGMKVLRSLSLVTDRGSFSVSNFQQGVAGLANELEVLEEVPICVGDLKHLRYLNFSYTYIERLPESIGGLCKLQALILKGCQKLSMLPQGITKLLNLQFLDIRDTRSLKEIPLDIGNLKNLIILSKFVVGLEKGSQLKELKNLPHLQGELLISELQKVEEVRDAIDANLIGKSGLSNLFLHWSKNFGNLRNGKREEPVLHSLRPNTNLEHLSISYYGGARFPSWLGGPTYSKIVSLCLRDCPNVTSIPSLGQLPSLKELSLEGLHAVSTIGPEFYGGKRPFSSLITLKFKEMLAWTDWSPYVRDPEEEVSFSCLQHLVVQSCPSLVKTLPHQLDCLTKLEIHSCPHLDNLANNVSVLSLHELYLKDCNEEILKILVNLNSLTVLKIENLAELVCFDIGFMGYLVKLKELHIEQCDKLNYLWRDGNETQNLTCLQSVVINSCPQFAFFVAGEGEMELCCNLEMMELRNCTSLEKLPSEMYTLRRLRIENCPKIMGPIIPLDDPSSNNPMSQLEFLYISGCASLISFSFGEARLASLKGLTIWECDGVESLEEIIAESLNSLTIMGSDCPTLEIEDFPPLPITLSSLSFINCPKIKSLPNKWHHLTSLRSLVISSCENIKCFPKGGLPPNLRWFSIRDCENMKQPVREWGLPMLTSLQHVEINGRSMGGERDKVRFPSGDEDEEEENTWSLLFPSSLTELDISHMRNVERLSNGLRNHLSSLRYLHIFNYPKLRDLPEDGLPPSLHRLEIWECENLKDRCSKLTGDYWPLIQEIPQLWIGGKRIH
ncbi:hypothetical protein BT93_B0702 [Corymbia citriodora subsp. variegata]|nr:hypothetical protein BT93_B0702 [Corymbia citriodora subsp. variegata]